MQDAMNIGLDRVVAAAFGALRSRAPTPEETQYLRNILLEGGRFGVVLSEILAGGPPRLDEVQEAVGHLYRLAFGRTPTDEEMSVWVDAVVKGGLSTAAMVSSIATSKEAGLFAASEAVLPDASDGVFIQKAFEVLPGRGAMADEIAFWQYRLASGLQTRKDLLGRLFNSNPAVSKAADAPINDTSKSYILGANKFVSVDEWRSKDPTVTNFDAAWIGADSKYSRFQLKSSPQILVSAIASLYRGRKYIEKFLDNIVSQSIFESHVELIFVDADSPEGEFEVIEKYMSKFKNIKYHRASSRIGIYDAWNQGISLSEGKYITNVNLDDLRRYDSFEIQAATLDNLDFIDVVYQDVLYTFDADLQYDEVAKYGLRSEVPIVTPNNILHTNAPHNAPMWRRKVHDDVGFFDTAYKSAGDCDFWIRCAQAGKVFYKINDPHVVYYSNPVGISTRPDTRGFEEWSRISKAHARNLISKHLTSPANEFVTMLDDIAGLQLDIEPDFMSEDWRYARTQAALRKISIGSRAGMAR